MARWIVYCVPLLLGILALASTVIQDVDGRHASGDNNGSVHSIAVRSSGDTSPSNSKPSSTGKNNKKGKKKSKKGKKYRKRKKHAKRPQSESSSGTFVRKPYKGTGGLGPLTWVAAFQAGRVYKGQEYFNTSRYAINKNKMPTICVHNNLTDYDDNNNVTLFYCPGDNDDDNLDHCCGDEGWEHCCSYESPNIVLILGILSALVAVAVIIFGCCVWKRIHKKSELEKQPADQVVSANLTDPMLPPTIVTSPPPPSPPPPQTMPAPQEPIGLPPIDGNSGGPPQPYNPEPPQNDGALPPPYPPKDHLVISSGDPLPSHPPPEAV